MAAGETRRMLIDFLSDPRVVIEEFRRSGLQVTPSGERFLVAIYVPKKVLEEQDHA
jgi:hypothetical protein